MSQLLAFEDVDLLADAAAPLGQWPWVLSFPGRAAQAAGATPTEGVLRLNPVRGTAHFSTREGAARSDGYEKVAGVGVIVATLCGILAVLTESWFFYDCNGLIWPDLGEPICAMSYESVLDFGPMVPAVLGTIAGILFFLLVLGIGALDKKARPAAGVTVPDELLEALRVGLRRLQALRDQEKKPVKAAGGKHLAGSRFLSSTAGAIGESLGGKFVGVHTEAAVEVGLDRDETDGLSMEAEIHEQARKLRLLVVEYNQRMRDSRRSG